MKTKNPKKVAMGKKNRASGAEFERRVRKDLEEKGWIVDKWSNNVEFTVAKSKREGDSVSGKRPSDGTHADNSCENSQPLGKLIPAKRKWAGPNRPMVIGTGMPDFIIFRRKSGKEILEELKDAFQKRNETME